MFPCPVCRTLESTNVQIDTGIMDELSRIKLKCPQSHLGCSCILNCGEVENHELQVCEFFQHQCPNRCQMEKFFFRQELEKHCKDECPKRLVQCSRCLNGKSFYFCELEFHYQKECPKSYVRCSFCLKFMQNRYIAEHHLQECPGYFSFFFWFQRGGYRRKRKREGDEKETCGEIPSKRTRTGNLDEKDKQENTNPINDPFLISFERKSTIDFLQNNIRPPKPILLEVGAMYDFRDPIGKWRSGKLEQMFENLMVFSSHHVIENGQSMDLMTCQNAFSKDELFRSVRPFGFMTKNIESFVIPFSLGDEVYVRVPSHLLSNFVPHASLFQKGTVTGIFQGQVMVQFFLPHFLANQEHVAHWKSSFFPVFNFWFCLHEFDSEIFPVRIPSHVTNP